MVSSFAIMAWPLLSQLQSSSYLNDLPDIAGISLAVIGILISLLPTSVFSVLERKRWVRWLLASAFIVLGIVAIVSSHTQKVASNKDRVELTKQIGQLIAASQMQATSDDIKRLGEDIHRIEAAIRGQAVVKQPPAETQLPPPAVEHLRYTQRRAPSDKPEFPYGLQVIVQTDINIQPVSLAIECDGEIGKVDFFVAGQGVYMMTSTGIGGPQKNVAIVKFTFPPITPETPLVITLLSKTDIRVRQIQRSRQ